MDLNTKLSCISNPSDIISAIDHKLQNNPMQWLLRHAIGHKNNHLGPLCRWASLNITCDTAAKQWWTIDKKRFSMHQHSFIQGEMWRLFMDSPTYPTSGKLLPHLGKKISTNMRECMEWSIPGPPILSRWHKIGTLNKENYHLVDWKALKVASSSATNYRRRCANRITAQ